MLAQGDIMICIYGDYTGHKVEVTAVLADYEPFLYACCDMTDGNQLALFDSELKPVDNDK